MDMDSKASAASGPNHSSGSAPIHSYPNSEYLEVKHENPVDNVVNGINDNKNTYGSDFGSETDEGFVSGGEEFETDSVAGKAAVMDPDEETVAKTTNDDAADTPVMDSSEFSMSEGVRPIAKVSTDDDEKEVVEGSLEDEGLGGKIDQDSSGEKENLGVEAVNLEEDKVGPVQAESAKDEYFGENVEISADSGDKKFEDENLEINVPSAVEEGPASEQCEVEQSEVIGDNSLKQQCDVSLNDKHKKAPTEDENVGGTVVGNTTPNGANHDAESAAAGKLDGATSVPSDDVRLTSERDSIVENVKANISEPGDVVVGDVKDTRDFGIEGVEKKGAPSDDVKLTSEGDSIVENVKVNISEPGVVVGDVKDTREFEIEEIEKNGAPCVPSDDVKLTSEGDSIVENVKVKSLESGVVVVGDVKNTKDLEIEEVEKNCVPCVPSTSEGDSIVEDVKVSFPEPRLVVVGDMKDKRDLEIREVEKNGMPCVPSDDVKLTSEGDSIVEVVKVNFPEPGVVVVGDVKDTRDLQPQGVEVPANGVNLANGFNQVEEDSHRSKNIDDHSMEKNGNSGGQTGKVEMSGEETLGSSVDQLDGDGENENSEAKTRDSVMRVDNDQIEAVPSNALNRVDEIQCRESESIASAVPDNGSLLNDGVFNMNPVANEGESKTTGEYDASEDLGSSSIVAADAEGKFADEEIEDSITDGETEGMIFESSEAAKQFLEELEKASGVGSLSTMEDSHDLSQKLDGQIVTDSDEEVDTDEEGESKELFDPAALAALLKAARGTGSDGGNVTITSQDGSRLFSVDRPAGLGSSLQSVKPGPRPSRGSIFSPSSLRVEADSDSNVSEQEKKKLENLQQVRIKFLRLVQRLGFTPEESMAAQVLYRLTLVAGRQTGGLFSLDAAKRTASELEAEGRDDLNFTINILVLGKAGVGKSATINSIFGETKTQTDAFGPATCGVREIVGVVGGVKLRVFDTPGLKSSAMEQCVNRKILSNVKNFTKKCPPDIILYVDRLDTQTRDLNDLPLLRSITSVLGPSIWRNAIVTLTHAASAPPDGPTGSPLSYDVFVAQRSHAVQQNIGQAVGDLRLMNPSLMNPVSLAENHPSCRKNRDGEKVLPNGQSWRPQLLLLCYSMKILSEASSFSKPKDPFDHKKLFGFRARAPPLPYLLSGLLQSRTHPKLSADQGGDNGDSDIDIADLSDSDHDEDEDEYDQLPAFKPLRKSQIAKLSREQKKAYFDEYDYRVKLLQKKQWREELKRMREMKKKGKASEDSYGEAEEGDESPATVAVPLPDMVLPPSFDGDNAAFRYRFLEPTSQFLTRPVLDTHGWDHDCGYDGVNLEHSLAIVSQFPAAYAVQITKDKKDFNIHLDSSVAVKHGENGSTMAGFDIQNIGKQIAYIVRGETKFKNFKRNKTAAGISVTFLGENVSTGVKVEDQIAIGKRLVLVGSTGTVRSQGDAAYGANMEVRIREADYPIGQDQSSLGLSLVKWRGDLALGANFQSQFSVGRSYKMALRAGLNNKLSGQITVKTSSSDQLQIALVAILPIVRAVYKNFWPGASENYSIY